MSSSRQLLPAAAIVATLFVSPPFMGSTAPGLTVIFVDDDAPLGGDGLTWNTAYRFIQDALAAAAASGGAVTEIHVAQGIYKPDRDEGGNVTPGDRLASFQLVNGLSLMGGYAGIGQPNPDEHDPSLHEAILSGDLLGDDIPNSLNFRDENSYHVLTAIALSQKAVLDGFTVRGGFAQGLGSLREGGGLRSEGSCLTLVRCTFFDNRAAYGAAMYSLDGDLTIQAVTFLENQTFLQSFGGAIYLRNCDSVLQNSAFTENTGRFGGAMLMRGGSTALENCSFSENRSFTGSAGAILFGWEPTATVTNCSFIANRVRQRGGAIQSVGATIEFTRCLFAANSAVSMGGAVDLRGSPLGASPTTFVDCLFVGNTVTEPSTSNGAGGAITAGVSLDPVVLSMTNCVLSANSATRFGGAVYIGRATAALRNCTVSGNSAGVVGGGLDNGGLAISSLENCVLWSNSDSEGTGEAAQIHLFPGANLTINHSCVQGWTGALGGVGNIGEDPLFVDPDGSDNVEGTVDDDFRLLPGSPCIDAADNTAVPEGITTDLDGNPRFVDDPDTPDTGIPDGVNPIVDMGAYEFQLPCPWDLNGDGVFDVEDVIAVATHFGPCP